MRLTPRAALAALAVIAAACSGGPPAASPATPAPPPHVLSDSQMAAVGWVQSHTMALSLSDSMPNSAERAAFAGAFGGARILGVSELTEGTHQFPLVVRHLLFALADSGVRGLALQAPMPEAMEVDRYVRGGPGDARRLLRALGSWRWETPEMVSLVNVLRAWNQGKASERQIGFYGFEIPTAEHAVNVVTSIPATVAGASLKAWFTREYSCVLRDESARFGRGGRAADSTFWQKCRPVAAAAVDSIVALRRRASNPPKGVDLAFVETMARLVDHHVNTGLRYLSRQDGNAEHVLYLANSLGPDAKLLVWGGDVEMGRLKLDTATVQTGVALNARLGARYRTLAFLFGQGITRTRTGRPSSRGEQPGLSSVTIQPPRPNTYEEVFQRATPEAYWLDLRTLPHDNAGTWLGGPHRARLITDYYMPDLPDMPAPPDIYDTPLRFPGYFDGVLFVRTVTPSR